jgi:CBS domain-containing protein/gamma-glutamylcysteine synthetase
MGHLDVAPKLDPNEFRVFTKALLNDLRALEQMLAEGRIETGARRIGTEQELFLVGPGWRPAPVAIQVLEGLDGEEYTTELAAFNLEINLKPLELEGRCLHQLEQRLDDHIEIVRTQAQQHNADVVLTGILPTLVKSDLSLRNMTPRERYAVLNDVLTRICGGRYRVNIQGADELNIEHDSVMLEGGNTSFQVHLQVDPEAFARYYNVAQVMTAPVLAASVNSPLLFGRRLWAETRIALFQQSIDTRRSTPHLRELTPRVRFGEQWVKESILEVFREDIARIPALMAAKNPEDPFAVLREGGVPSLVALQMYNGTVYRWNRPCYGIYKGKPHLRIECRFLPSGPTVIDEVANAAFWTGLVLEGAEQYPDITERIPFDDARANVLAAARRGLNVGFTWLDGRTSSARDLLLQDLIPMARAGLRRAGIQPEDADHYLDVIEGRVESGGTGAHWLERSLLQMGSQGTRSERLAALTAATADRQQSGKPGHEWELASIEEGGGWKHHYLKVEQYMTTDLFTVKQDELVDLAALLMDWKHIRQVPVEDEDNRLVGLVSFGSVLRLLASGDRRQQKLTIPVRDIMDSDPVTIGPETSTLEAIELMRQHRIPSLPVVKDDKLVGIVSVGDFMPMVQRLLHERLQEEL